MDEPRSPRRFGAIVIAVAALAVWPALPASAQSRAATGEKLAGRYCSQCHVIAPNGEGGWTDAPKFEDIANRPTASAAALSAFTQQPHIHMVNTGRPRGEANDLAAYIMSLRHK